MRPMIVVRPEPVQVNRPLVRRPGSREGSRSGAANGEGRGTPLGAAALAGTDDLSR
jgi:hypothetical protein